ncbi:extracellular solute-binding protein [Glycomyces sp. NPDC021274]|uniref:ABC transporter substrate-binding protein n=1 Tax=Glycomyces sp. NPDC021274 TaxID=3155120 RepID=UPI0034022C8B
MERRLIFRGLGASAVALPGLAACGTGGGADVELSDEDVTLRMTWWGSDLRHGLTQEAIEAFQKEHPNITVKTEFKDWTGYWDALATTTAANDSPDVIQMDEQYLASYGERGTLLDLADAEEYLDTSKIDESLMDSGKVGGTQYAVPIGAGVLTLVANADLFAQYGVELPDDSAWTWEDYAALAAELTEKSGGAISGSGVTGGFDHGSVRYWARQNGSDLFTEGGDVALDPALLVEQWEFFLGLMESGAVESAAAMVESINGGVDSGNIATGKVAMGNAYNTMISALRNASGADLRLLRPPLKEGGDEGLYFKPSMYWSISSQSEHPAEAALLIDFLVNSEAAADILKTERGIPANTAIRERVSADLEEGDQLALDYMNSIEPGPVSPVTPNGGSNVDPMIQRYAQEVYFGEREPAEAAEAFVAELQGEIDAAK